MQGMSPSIHSLVSSIRSNEGKSVIRNHISDIATLVGRVVTAAENSVDQSTNSNLREKVDIVVQNLADCRIRLLDLSAESETIQDPSKFKEFTNSLPPVAFEIVRETKELVRRLDELSDADEEESFR
jgi:G protein-coupled receptor kinase-interacting protein 1 C term